MKAGAASARVKTHERDPRAVSGPPEPTPIAGINPVFVVGCPRSGTTILQKLLSAHSNIAVAPETHFVRRYIARGGPNRLRSESAEYDRTLSVFTSTAEFKESQVAAESFRHYLGVFPKEQFGIFAAYLAAFRDANGVTFIGEKTPNHLLYMHMLVKAFPGARFIHIVRDPRAVVSSWRGVPWSRGTARGDARVWDRYQKLSQVFERSHPDLVLIVKYEDLMKAPREELSRVCDFVGTSFENQMLEGQAPVYVANVAREPWKRRAVEGLDAARLGAWREELSGKDVRHVEAVVYRRMKARGYAPESSPLILLMERGWLGIRNKLRRVRRPRND